MHARFVKADKQHNYKAESFFLTVVFCGTKFIDDLLFLKCIFNGYSFLLNLEMPHRVYTNSSGTAENSNTMNYC